MKDIKSQILEALHTPSRIHRKQITPKHITVKLLNIKIKKEILKAARGLKYTLLSKEQQ